MIIYENKWNHIIQFLNNVKHSCKLYHSGRLERREKPKGFEYMSYNSAKNANLNNAFLHRIPELGWHSDLKRKVTRSINAATMISFSNKLVQPRMPQD